MSKKRIEVLPYCLKSEPTTIVYGIITKIQDDCVLASFDGASQLIPKYRFIKEDDKEKLCIGAKVKVNRYFSDLSRKKLLAYNAELTSE